MPMMLRSTRLLVTAAVLLAITAGVRGGIFRGIDPIRLPSHPAKRGNTRTEFHEDINIGNQNNNLLRLNGGIINNLNLEMQTLLHRMPRPELYSPSNQKRHDSEQKQLNDYIRQGFIRILANNKLFDQDRQKPETTTLADTKLGETHKRVETLSSASQFLQVHQENGRRKSEIELVLSEPLDRDLM